MESLWNFNSWDGKTNPEVHINCQWLSIAKTILKKKNQVAVPIFLHCKNLLESYNNQNNVVLA